MAVSMAVREKEKLNSAYAFADYGGVGGGNIGFGSRVSAIPLLANRELTRDINNNNNSMGMNFPPTADQQ